MKTSIARAAAAALVVVLGAAPVRAGQGCAPRATVLERLTGHFGETRQSIGLGANNAVIEVFASDSTGSWTIVATLPNGLTCLLAAGEAFERLEEPGQDGSPA